MDARWAKCIPKAALRHAILRKWQDFHVARMRYLRVRMEVRQMDGEVRDEEVAHGREVPSLGYTAATYEVDE